MKRYGYNSRLFRDELQEKRHYKMYKKGRMWLVAGISLFSSGLTFSSLNGVSVKADTLDTTATANTPDDTANSGVPQSNSNKPATDAVSPVATQAKTDTDSGSATPDSSSSNAVKAASSTDQSSVATTDSASNSDAAATNDTTAKSATQKAADQSTPTASATDATKASDANKSTDATDAASTKTAKITEYSKGTGQTLIKQATQAQTQVQTDFNQSNALADANPEDNIPRDDALAALVTHQAAQKASVNDAVTSADVIAATDKQTALDNLNKALTVVDNMNNEVEQAGVLLAADKKGVQANVVTNAQNAYEKVSLPNGVNTKLDAYGDLIVTASNDQAFQSILANLTDNGLIGSFREVVDPAESASLSFIPSNYDSGAPMLTINSDGSATFNNNDLDNLTKLVQIKFVYTGAKGDQFHLTVPAGSEAITTQQFLAGYRGKSLVSGTGDPEITVNSDGSSTLTWTVNDASTSYSQTVNLTGMGDSNFQYFDNDDDHTPATSGIGTTGITPDQQILPISYGGTNLPEEDSKIIISSNRKIASTAISVQNGVNGMTKLTGVDYAYQITAKPDGTPVKTIEQNNFYLKDMKVNVPSNFTLDAAKTSYVLNNTSIGNLLKVTQPGGKGTQLVILPADGSGYTRWISTNNISFVGSYSSGTTGSQTFSVDELIYSRNHGDVEGTIYKTNGAETNFTPLSSPVNGWITFDGDKGMLTETVDDSKKVKNINLTSKGPNSANELLIGDSDTNVLGTFGYTNFGNIQDVGTVTVNVGTGIDSTGVYLPLQSSSLNDISMNGPMKYDVTVHYSDGTSQSLQDLNEGTTVSSIPQTGTVNVTKTMNIPNGAHVVSYQISPTTPIQPGDDSSALVGGGGEQSAQSISDNDLLAQRFGLLGYVDDSVQPGTNLSWNVAYVDQSGYSVNAVPVNITAIKDAPISANTLISDALLKPGDTFTAGIGVSGDPSVTTGINLNADGWYLNKLANPTLKNSDPNTQGSDVNTYANKPSEADANDLPGFSGITSEKKDPILYVTVPKQTQLVKNADGSIFSEDGAGWFSQPGSPTVTSYTNADGQTVYKLDYSGTGVLFNPNNMRLNFNFKVDSDAVSDVIGLANTEETNVSYGGSNYNVKSATNGGSSGEANALFLLAGTGNSAFLSNTQTFKQSNASGLFTILTDSNGNTQKVDGLSAYSETSYPFAQDDSQSLGGAFFNTFTITAPATVTMIGTIQDNQTHGTTYKDKGVNNPIPTDQQTIRLRLSNATSNSVTNVAGVLNLPQTISTNTPTTPGQFKLTMTGPVTEGTDSAGNSTTTYYATQSMTLDSSGKFLTLQNGSKYYFNPSDGTSTASASDLMPVSAVTDWSKITSLVTTLPSLNKSEVADVLVPVKDLESSGDAGKQVTIPVDFRADGQKNIQSQIVDAFATTAKIKYVDQDGKEINGSPELVGKFLSDGTPDPNGGPTGAVGDPITPNIVPTLPGYVFINTDGDNTFKVDGSATIVNHYQVSEANLTTVNKPGGTQINETAKGDTTPNMTTGDGSATATGTANIKFTNTDTSLAVPGYTYTVSVNGGTPVLVLLML